MKKLRIAVLASDFIRVPPRPQDVPSGSSGAPEIIASQITEGMVKRGHQVTLFASGNSSTRARLVSLQAKSTGVDRSISRGPHVDFEYALISACFQMANKNKFDIIHSHFDDRSSFLAPFSKVPVVSTLHSPLVGNKKKLLEIFPRSQYYVSISNAQRRGAPGLKYIKTIYHGLNVDKMPFSAVSKGYLVFIGRIRPEKGIDRAIAVAKKAKKKLIIFGSHVNDDYWHKKIKPWIDGRQIEYKGHVSQKKIFEILKYAEAFIFPIRWDEPFGLVLIEAMSCGVPVVAFEEGSVPELVRPGINGYIVNDVLGMVGAVKEIKNIDRQSCREYAKENFNIDKMIDNYEEVYQTVIKRHAKIR